MRRPGRRSFVLSVAITLTLVLLLAAVGGLAGAPAASAYSGGVHHIATQRAVDVMQVFSDYDAIVGLDGRADERLAAGAHFYPELSNDGAALGLTLVDSAMNYDDYVGGMGTRNHFWTCDEGLHELPEGIVGLDNAWEVARREWVSAVMLYKNGFRKKAYTRLGRVLHLVEDMAQPAHTNSDLHGPTNRDSLEEWGGYAIIDPMYSWTDPAKASPGKIFQPPLKRLIIQRVRNRPGWEGHDEFLEDKALMDPNDPYNRSQLFWIMYVANQWANYFASDGEKGNTGVALGWVDYEALGFPDHLHAVGVEVSPQRERALDDNDRDCPNGNPRCGNGACDCDGDLTTIATWGYKAAMKGSGGVIELFRRTVDTMNPRTQVTCTREDDKTYVAGGWNNSRVTVRVHSAVDPATPTLQDASGVWALYAIFDGELPGASAAASGELYHFFELTGAHTVQVRTADSTGRVEHKDVAVKVDLTPPVIDLSQWRSSYLSCEQPPASFAVSDTPSGVKSVAASVDGTRVVVGQPIDRLLLGAGSHELFVKATDKALNTATSTRGFRVVQEVGLTVGTPMATRVPGTMRFQFTGTLAPQHYAGTRPITIVIEKRERPQWKVFKKVAATIGEDGSYRCAARLPLGDWRARAMHLRPRVFSDYVRFKL